MNDNYVPVARIMPAAPEPKRPRFGACAGKDLLRVGNDFDEPLADVLKVTELPA
jgi:hypothetical protein